jgi:hypothetical protein
MMRIAKNTADMKIIPRDCAVWLICSVTSTYPNLIAMKDNPIMKPCITNFSCAKTLIQTGSNNKIERWAYVEKKKNR